MNRSRGNARYSLFDPQENPQERLLCTGDPGFLTGLLECHQLRRLQPGEDEEEFFMEGYSEESSLQLVGNKRRKRDQPLNGPRGAMLACPHQVSGKVWDCAQ